METALAAALDAVLAEVPGSELQRTAARLTAAYRSDALPGDLLTTPLAARAYAAYRMPATYAAVRAALRAAPGLAPRTLLDVGGGTGAALWAAAATLPSLERATVLDRSADALALGRELAAHAPAPVGTATWTRAALGGDLPAADLTTMAYVLAELPAAARTALVAAAPGDAVAIVEPGTPAGYRRVLEARDLLLGRGWTVAAPCPHDRTCPWAGTADWCHFAARLPRSGRHRQVKGGTLGWEDEKFSYVVATREPAGRAGGRIVRHPYLRKGLVELTVCAAEPGIDRRPVSRRQGPAYRAARDADWGDPWPPGPAGPAEPAGPGAG